MKNELIKLMKMLINIESFTEEGRGNIMDSIQNWVVTETNNNPIQIGKNLIFEHKNKENAPMVWSMVHADTVIPSEGWLSDPCGPIEKDGRMIGLGSTDMKAGVAVNMILFDWIVSMDLPINFSLVVTQDEETGGNQGLPVLIQNWDKFTKPGFAIVNEPTPDQKISMGESGVLALKLKWNGESLHCGRAELQENAIFRASLFVAELREKILDKVQAVNPTIIKGGHNQNSTPQEVEMVLDIRFKANFSTEQIFDIVKNFENTPDQTEIMVRGEARETKKDKFFEILSKSLQETGEPEPVTRKPMGVNDARFFFGTGINSAVFGTSNIKGNHHGPNEFVIIDDLVLLFERMKKFVINLSKEI